MMIILGVMINMRLWHHKLIPYLPNKMLISQWRELIAIKRQWEKGILKHRLVSYVMNYHKKYLRNYAYLVMEEMRNRHINFKRSYFTELCNFGYDDGGIVSYNLYYKEHNNRYLKQCLYNLQEKYDRDIITEEEWEIIENKFKDYIN